jgi:glycosyltransferase involved in cell wall biosynthesis
MGQFTAINQFHDSTAIGDAITNDMLEIRAHLRGTGVQSDIFATSIAPGLEREIRRIHDYPGDDDALLIIHHSQGFDEFDRIIGLPDRKILRYHNITPPEFLPNPHLQHYSRKGREQLCAYAQEVEKGVAVSAFNARELAAMGYEEPSVIPIFFNAGRLSNAGSNPEILKSWKATFNLVFVGRICPNKRQDELIQIFDGYHSRRPDSRLLLVGSSHGTEEYGDYLRQEITALGLNDAVLLAGKVSQSDLASYYRVASVFTCASEHEGFCVPLLEAMVFGVPVIAYNCCAVPEIVDKAGVLLDDKNPGLWLEVIDEFRFHDEFRKEVLERQRCRVQEFTIEKTGTQLRQVIDDLKVTSTSSPRKPSLQIQGPFETSYSLAVVNRNLGLSLDAAGTFDVSIHCTEGPGDYEPKPQDLDGKPVARGLWQKSKRMRSNPDVVVRNLYPPRVLDSNGNALNFLYFFWEDSLVPKTWIRDFNAALDAVLVPSKHVEEALIASGLKIPTFLLSPGVEDRFFHTGNKQALRDKRTFTFLHISSGFPRKGIDKLLAAYFTEFSPAENVRLLLKTFPNPHNTVGEQIRAWRSRGAVAQCEHIDTDFSDSEVDLLYDEADCAVYPSRCEGFGLPLVEAMARRIPVISTAYGGQMDFCSAETALLVSYKLAPSESHFQIAGAHWAEPDVDDLRRQMRYVFQHRDSAELRHRIEAAHSLIATSFRWSETAQRFAEIVSSSLGTEVVPKKKLAMVTSWNARCGIAEYTRYLLDEVEYQARDLEITVLSSPQEGVWDDSRIPSTVCWQNRGVGDLHRLRELVSRSDFDIVHFQFNFGFFALEDFASTLDSLKRAGKKTVITFHRSADLSENGKVISLRQISSNLKAADLLLVHSPSDRDRLAEFGLTENVRILPHGNVVPAQDGTHLRRELKITFKPILGTFGFLLPHKGILELIEAMNLLRDEMPGIALFAQCALHQNPISQEFEEQVRARIRILGLERKVFLSTAFLQSEEALEFLQLADFLVLPYKESPESTSAAIRFALACSRPVITTKCGIFEDAADATYQIDSNEPQQIAAAIRRLVRDRKLSDQLAASARKHVEATNWSTVAKQYLDLLRSIDGSHSNDDAEHPYGLNELANSE